MIELNMKFNKEDLFIKDHMIRFPIDEDHIISIIRSLELLELRYLFDTHEYYGYTRDDVSNKISFYCKDCYKSRDEDYVYNETSFNFPGHPDSNIERDISWFESFLGKRELNFKTI